MKEWEREDQVVISKSSDPFASVLKVAKNAPPWSMKELEIFTQNLAVFGLMKQ